MKKLTFYTFVFLLSISNLTPIYSKNSLNTSHNFVNKSTSNAMQSSSFTQVRLYADDGSALRFFRVFYLSQNGTKGFDNGYDGEVFGGVTNTFDMFTHLVSGDNGKKYQIQALPLQEVEEMIVPINIVSVGGKQIEITSEIFNFPPGLKVYFEDKLTNTITRLDEPNSSYVFTTSQAINGYGRFFMYVTSSVPIINTTWTGATNTDWNTSSNWTNGVPTGIVNAIIPDVLNAPVINSTTKTTVNNLTITEPDGVTINSDGVLIVNGTSSGSVTYKRTLNSEKWFLVASPISGETFNNDFVSDNNLAINGTNNAIATYTTSNDTWAYMQTGGGGAFTPGVGYSVRRATGQGAGDISFTGNINTNDISVNVSNSGNAFNLLGNPYTSYLNNVTFITDNSSKIVGNQIWVWNQNTNNYEVKNLVETLTLAPAQGFIIKAASATNLNYAKFRQLKLGNAFQKTSKPEITLNMTDGSNNRFAKIYYLDNATTGFDNGYDGETFGGIENKIDVFTHLVANSVGKKYQIQSLPNDDFENSVIPVGVKAAAGKELSFTAEANAIPNGIKVYLEDKIANKVTVLSEADASYKVTLTESLDGIGRFYLHTKASGVLSTETIKLDNISVYTTNASTIKVVGLSQEKATIKLFSILGKKVFETSFKATNVNEIQIPVLSSGVYIVQLFSEKGKVNRKIVVE